MLCQTLFLLRNTLYLALNKTLDINFEAGSIDISFTKSNIKIKNFSFSKPDSNISIRSGKSMYIALDFSDLLSRQLTVSQLDINGLFVSYENKSNFNNIDKSDLHSIPEKFITKHLLSHLNIEDISINDLNFSLKNNEKDEVNIVNTKVRIPKIAPHTKIILSASGTLNAHINNKLKLNIKSFKAKLKSNLAKTFIPEQSELHINFDEIFGRINDNEIHSEKINA